MARVDAASEVQAELSNASGTFTSGTRILSFLSYSTDNGTTFTPGPYIFTGDVAGLIAKVPIPAGTAAGNAYSLRIRATDGTIASVPFKCPAGTAGHITVVLSGNILPRVPQTEEGVGQWIGHVYTWTPTTTIPLVTDAQVDSQDFYNPANYIGHTLYNPLNLDLSFSTTGGVPGSTSVGTSIACGSTVNTQFSMRLRRKETFTPGYYTFTIGGDDGIRLSLDGGTTWVLSSFRDQQYPASVRSTSAAFPNGICLSGPIDLVLEYYQNPLDSRFTFAVSSVGLSFTQPTPQSTCEGANATFQFGNADPNGHYKWQFSTDGGANFSDLADGGIYSGVTSFTLAITNAPIGLNGVIYRCLLTNNCVTDYASDTVSLHVSPGNAITQQPETQTICPAEVAHFTIAASGMPTYQWQVNSGTGFVNANLDGFTGAQTDSLTVLFNSQVNMNGWKFRCLILGSALCNAHITSDEAVLNIDANLAVIKSPADAILCNGQPAKINIITSGSGIYQWQVSSDNGASWTDISDAAPYIGTTTDSLTIADLPDKQSELLFRALVSNNCNPATYSAPARVSRCCTVAALPNVFTPNGDGINDAFGQISCTLQDFDMKIYNRWGKLVFKVSDATNGWTGNGMGAGVYFYQVRYTYQGISTSAKGNIELVR